MDDGGTSSKRLSVRPRASHRKQRTAEPQRARLEPVQVRSRERNEQILQAAARLLESVNIEDLSHSDIAAEAGVSKPSVHYHYPTVAAIQLELGRRYDEEVAQEISAFWARQTEPPRDWHDLLKRGAAFARDWFNAHRPACETLLGPSLTRENRIAGMGYNSQIGNSILKRMQDLFVLPNHPNLQEVFSCNGEITDLFWSRSYLTKGHIDDAALEDGIRGSIGYLRNFLPEYLPRRSDAPHD